MGLNEIGLAFIALLVGGLIAGIVTYLVMNRNTKQRLDNAFKQGQQHALMTLRQQEREKVLQTNKFILPRVAEWGRRSTVEWRIIKLATANGGKLLYVAVPFGGGHTYTAKEILGVYPRTELKNEGDEVVFRAVILAVDGPEHWDIGLAQLQLGITLVKQADLYAWIPAHHRHSRQGALVTRMATQHDADALSTDRIIEAEEGVIQPTSRFPVDSTQDLVALRLEKPLA